MNDSTTLKTRREFLRTTMLGGALSWTVPTFLANTFSALHAAAADRATQIATGKDAPILVVLQLAGGNDGLNTVIPFANDHYHKARPTLGLKGDRVLKLNDSLGLHPALAGFKSLYDAGQLGIVQGVGYPNPNRSHFRSTDIWMTASDADRFENRGWIGRYFDANCDGCDPTVGIAVGRQMPLAFAGKQPKGVALDNPANYRFKGGAPASPGEMDTTDESFKRLNFIMDGDDGGANAGASIGAIAGQMMEAGAPLDFIERTALDAQVSSDQIRAIASKVRNAASYPASQLGNSLGLVARLIGGGLSTRVFYVSQGGYDTHTNQGGTHERLLKDLADSVKAFTDDLKSQGNQERVLVMTFSEFGRRVAQNGSQGTDHGAASTMFLIGGKTRSGLLGEYPSLAPRDLLQGDLKFTVDFRSVYAGVLEQWLQTPSEPILGRRFTPLPIV
ncbi:MAG: DUF1501 domain-containing protein [Limisphaerales bacterium]